MFSFLLTLGVALFLADAPAVPGYVADAPPASFPECPIASPPETW
jgi:hypothetical protein